MSIDQDNHPEAVFVDRLADAFREAALGMALLAPNGTFLRANEALCHLVGRSEDQLRREELADIVDDPRVTGALAAAEPSLQLEAPMRHREGRPVVGLVTLTLVRDERGAPQCYVCQV